MRPAPDLEAAMTRAIEELYPIDETGLRVYNPDGVRVVNISELLEITHDETYPDRRPDRAGSAESHGSCDEAQQDDAERPRGDSAARAPGRVCAGSCVQDQVERTSVTNRELPEQIDAVATTVRAISRATTRLRRSVAADAEELVDLERIVDGTVRTLRDLQQQIKERR